MPVGGTARHRRPGRAVVRSTGISRSGHVNHRLGLGPMFEGDSFEDRRVLPTTVKHELHHVVVRDGVRLGDGSDRSASSLKDRAASRGEGWRRGTLIVMFHARRVHRYTYADYVALESTSSTKHEFLDGEIYAMAGGTEEHSALSAEMLRVLGNAIGERPCRAHTSDLRLYVEAAGLATFPDASVICGQLEQHGPSPTATALNPSILVEVTSDSSEEYDTGTKLDAYRTIPSLREYIIVSHRERRITVHSRTADTEWTTRVAISGGRVGIGSLGFDLVVDEIYRASNIAPLQPATA